MKANVRKMWGAETLCLRRREAVTRLEELPREIDRGKIALACSLYYPSMSNYISTSK